MIGSRGVSSASILSGRLIPMRAMSSRERVAVCLAGVLHAAALIVMVATEADPVAKTTFLLIWVLLNCFWLALLRRPVVAALLSLELIVALTLLSRFKFDKLWMTVQEAAGAPLDASCLEQKEILQRCHGVFYRCADGAEARRFNRLLIDAGLVKGL